VDVPGKAFYTVVTYDQALDADWHHMYFMKDSLLDRHEEGEIDVFELVDGEIVSVYYSDVSPEIEQAIMAQIEPGYERSQEMKTRRGSWVRANGRVSPEEMEGYVNEQHFPDEYTEGDLDERIYSFTYYVYDPAFPIAKIDLEQWDLGEEKVEEWMEKIRVAEVPTVVLGDYGVEGVGIIDGTHRANAAARLGKSTIPAYIGKEWREV